MKHALSRRGFLQTVGLGTLGAALAACAPVTQTPAGEQTTAPSAAKTTTYIFDYDPTGTDAWVTADAEFVKYFAEKYPDIEAVREQAPWTGFTEKLLTSVAGGSKYDVIYGYWEWLPLLRENNVVGPLDDLLAADGEIPPDDFYEYAKELVDDQTYGLAWFISGWLHWYNNTVLEEAGYETPKAMNAAGTWNYDAWLQLAKDFTAEVDGTPRFGFDMNATRSATAYIMLAWAHGTEFWNEDFTQSLVNSPENVQLWGWIQQFFQEGLSPAPGTGTQEQAPGFTNGRAVGNMAGQWYTRNIVQDGADQAFAIGMAPFPTGPSGQYSIAALNSFYFGSAPENPEAAWTWYKERSFSETAATLYAPIGGSRFPSRKSMAPTTLYDWEDTEVYEAIRPTLRTYRTSPKETEWTTMWQAAWDELVLGTRPVEEILGQLAEESVTLVNG